MTRPQNYAAVEAYAAEYKRLEERGFVDAVEPGAMPTALEQSREDAALGAAWRRCEAALPEGWFAVEVVGAAGRFLANAYAAEASVDELAAELMSAGPTPTAALEALLAKLEGLEP